MHNFNFFTIIKRVLLHIDYTLLYLFHENAFNLHFDDSYSWHGVLLEP